jgi:hypothetical protein
MILLLVIGALLGGLGFLAVGFGLPIKDTTFGNAILLAGVMLLCSSLVIVGLAMVVRELKAVSRAIAQGALRTVPRGQPGRQPPAPRPAPPAPPPIADQQTDPPLAAESPPAEPRPAAPAAPPPWAAEAAARDRVRTPLPPNAPPAEEPAPPAPERPRRNLLFATRRRDRADQSAGGTPAADQAMPAELPPMAPPVLPPTPALEAEPRASFESAWPSRGGDPFGRRTRAAEPQAAPTPSATPAENPAEPPALPPADASPAVTVIKSGVVDGMAYSLYSDGSIEAQMPEGMLRFASLDELRSHLDQRP